MKGYFLMADILGFTNIVRNNDQEALSDRIKEWVTIVETAAQEKGISKIQLISDTVFAGTDASSQGMAKLVDFSQKLLFHGIRKSLPVRGAITYGDFEWGNLTYGNAVVRAHELETSQNWIGIICDNNVRHKVWRIDSLICYLPPMKRGLLRLYPVISWEVPSFNELAKCLVKGGLSKEGEFLDWNWGEKVTNTLLFGMYRKMLDSTGKTCNRFYGHLPVESIEMNLFRVNPCNKH